MKNKTKFNITGYTTVRHDRSLGNKGGLAILIRNGINYTEVITIQSIDMEYMEVKLKTDNGFVTVSNCYNPPGRDIESTDLEIIFRNPGNKLIVGDFNAKSPLWGSPVRNAIGSQIESILYETDLVVLNGGQATRQNYDGNMFHLDTSFASPNLAAKSTWSVLNNCMGSDHLPIIITIGEDINSQCDEATRFRMNTADWTLFKQACKQNFTDQLESVDIEEFGQNIINAIIAAAEVSIKETQNRKGRKYKLKCLPYWNNRIREIITKRNTARNKMNKTKNQDDCKTIEN